MKRAILFCSLALYAFGEAMRAAASCKAGATVLWLGVAAVAAVAAVRGRR